MSNLFLYVTFEKVQTFASRLNHLLIQDECQDEEGKPNALWQPKIYLVQINFSNPKPGLTDIMLKDIYCLFESIKEREESILDSPLRLKKYILQRYMLYLISKS